MMSFSAYEKMPTSLKKIGLPPRDFIQLKKLQWVVTEKIHGANFSFIYDQQQLKFAKRKAMLTWQDDFFGFQTVVQQMEHQVMALFEQLSLDVSANRYIIYGELFGGRYPHPAVKADENVQAIQTGIYYSPTIQFCAFDIAVVEAATGSKSYLDYEQACFYFKQYNLLHAEALQVGTLNEALDFNIQINSTVPALLNLPDLSSNLIEGVVIKPFQHTNTNLSMRPILKIKNPQFEENARFHQAQKWSYVPKVHTHTEDLSFLVEAMQPYVTVNRLESAISKIGAFDATRPTRLQAIQTECVVDVFVDFNEQNEQILEELNPAQKDWIRQRIEAMVQSLMYHRI